MRDRGRGLPPVGGENLIGATHRPVDARWHTQVAGLGGAKVVRGRSKMAGAGYPAGVEREGGSSRRVDGTVTTLSDLRS